MYKYTIGGDINWENPKTFQEKLQWLKLNDRNPLYSQLVDKYEVKKWVAEKIGEEHVIPTLGVWNHFDEIDFSKLPDSFVLKCTHDSGSVIICQDKKTFDEDNARGKLEKALSRNFYWQFREWPYKNVKPRIIAEPFLSYLDEDGRNKPLKDYKFFCFNGQVHFFKIDFNRFINHKANYYDREFNLLPFGEKSYPFDTTIQKEIPNNFQDMIASAEKLAQNFPFVRVDFFKNGNSFYVGELTFYPSAGFDSFYPSEWNRKLGDILELTSIFNK